MDMTSIPNQPRQENAIESQGYIAASLLVLGLLVSAGAEANGSPPHDLTQQLAQNMSTEDRAALREQLGNRMREISPAEQSLMRDSAYDGRKHMENGEAARTEQRGGRNEGGGYGRGHESRQDGNSGMGNSGGGRGVGGRRGR